MAEDPGQVGARRLDAEEDKSAEQLRAEIEETREELGDTVEALAAKTDVKTRAREKADELKRSATEKKDELIAKVKPSQGDASSGAPAAGAEQTGPGAVERAKPAMERLKGLAQENPVQTAAIGAFVGGLLLGVRLGRRSPQGG
jgi:ElaB/YqjD/DUF883 family membrane-anchored ribosome-binding protein